MASDNSLSSTLCTQCVKRVVQLETTVDALINQLDLGVSGIYDNEKNLRTAMILSSILDQMNSDLQTMIVLLDD